MIQRIQTLYLLLAAGLVACAAFLPLASFASGGEEFRLYAFGLRTADGETVQSTLYMGILLALALVLPLTTIFLFKRRMLQFRLGVVEMILLLGAQIVMGIYYFLSYRLLFVRIPRPERQTATGAAAHRHDLHLSGRPCHFPGRTDDPFDGPHPLRKYTAVCDADPFPDGSASALFPPEKKNPSGKSQKTLHFFILSAKNISIFNWLFR